jgi:hypothetical protein
VLTKDGDYASKLTPTQAKGFLNDEWLARKSGKIHLYEQLSQFFKNNFPAVDFSLETEKRQAIDAFLNSGSFGSTHSAVALLSSYIDLLSNDEVEEIIHSGLENNQVAWILGDSDVNSFFNRLLAEHGEALSPNLKSRLQSEVKDRERPAD